MARKIIPIAIGAVLVVVVTGYAAIALLSPDSGRQASEPVQETRAASGKQEHGCGEETNHCASGKTYTAAEARLSTWASPP